MRWKSGVFFVVLASLAASSAVSAQSLGQALGLVPANPAAKPAGATPPAAVVDGNRPVKHRAAARSTAPAAIAANTAAIGVMSEGARDRDMRMAADFAATFDKAPGVRVVALIGRGTVQNIYDLAYLKGVDAAIVNSDALDIAGKLGEMPNIDKKITYIARLQNEEMHVLAPNEITDIHQLAGKRVNVSIAGGGAAASSANIFEHLGIKVQQVFLPESAAGEKLKAGEIDAAVFWDPYPDETITSFKNDGRFHLIGVPYEKSLQSVYYPANFAPDAYPGLVPAGQKLETVSLNAVIAAYNWPRGADRYQHVARFAKQFFQRFAELQGPGRDAVWKSINPIGVAQGWTRFPAAQEWIDANIAHPTNEQADPSIAEFKAFLEEQGKAAATDPANTEKLFEQFVAWRKAKAAAPQPN